MTRRLSFNRLPLIVALITLFALSVIKSSWREKMYDTINSLIWSARKAFLPTNNPPEQNATIHTLGLQQEHKALLQRGEDALYASPSFRQGAFVLFKEHPPLGSAIWIDAGITNWNNSNFQIAPFCPVLSEGHIVGYVQYVGSMASRVLLISDPACFLSVKAQRPVGKNSKLLASGQAFRSDLHQYLSTQPSSEQSIQRLSKAFDTILRALNDHAGQGAAYTCFAYGQLQGQVKDQDENLHGFGFTCDTTYEDSPKRDLRTGKQFPRDQKTAIIKPNDLLITSGLDGIFPPGLPVARVATVFPLSEGDAFYTIEAKPLHRNLHHLSYVTILPAKTQEWRSPPSTIEQILSSINEEY